MAVHMINGRTLWIWIVKMPRCTQSAGMADTGGMNPKNFKLGNIVNTAELLVTAN